MIDDELRGAITKALKKAQKTGDLPAFEIPEVPVERPKQEDMGDYATPVCMQLARYARMAPIKIAEIVTRYLRPPAPIGAVEVAHPGFINFRLSDAWLTGQVADILARGDTYAQLEMGKGTTIQVEYVSANPTGPLHMGSARNAVLGDAIASVLAAAGYQVQREYYVNDAGSRMQVFFQTLYARYAQQLGGDEQVPEDGYHGPYMIDLGQEIAEQYGHTFLEMPRDEALAAIGELGLQRVIDDSSRRIWRSWASTFDNWFSEQSAIYRRRIRADHDHLAPGRLSGYPRWGRVVHRH